MGLFGKLRGKKKDYVPINDTLPAGENGIDGNDFPAEDFSYSQNIYNRNLYGVHIYEIQAVPPDNDSPPYGMVLGEFVEMTEGLLTLSILTKRDGNVLFSGKNRLYISYSKHGESFLTEAKIVEAYAADDGGSQTGDAADRPRSYIVQAMLCSEPVRHQRKHGRLDISWTVFFKADEDGQDFSDFSRNITAKTIDISEGGFKGRVDRQFLQDTVIRCIIEADDGQMSNGELIGKVIRCCHAPGNAFSYEMTVQFTSVSDSVRSFIQSHIEKLHPGAKNAQAKITISEQGREAMLELLPPENNGCDLSYEELTAALKNEKVTYGIDYELLKSLSVKPHYNLEHIIARCTPPVHGSDALLTFHIDMNPTFTPKVNEDGSADFKDLGLIQKVGKDTVLAEKTPATAGTPGRSITGEILEAIPGKDTRFPAGKNTLENENGTALLAGCDGFISITGQKINVLNVYTVEGDVQYSTGNIDHNGIVVVKGDVRSGFSVTAEGDIIIHGSVESAVLRAGGNIVIHGGCVGEFSNIEAEGNIAAKFIDGGVITSRGCITTSYMLGAVIKCGGSVDMVDTGLIRNSHITARVAVNAKIIGGERTAADNTVIETGIDPELLSRHAYTVKAVSKLNRDLESARTNIRTLTMLKYKKEKSGDKLTALGNYKLLADRYAGQLSELTQTLEVLNAQIDELGYGEVTVSGVAYGGLKVIIGSCDYTLSDAVKSIRFYRSGNAVKIEPLTGKPDKLKGLLRRSDLDK